MAYIDIKNDMSNAALTSASGAAQYGTIIDTGEAARQIGVGTPIQVRLQIDTLIVVDETNTLTLTLETSAAANMDTPTILTTYIAAAESTAAGTEYLFTLPASGFLRYMAIRAVPAATKAFTAGKFTAFLEPHIG